MAPPTPPTKEETVRAANAAKLAERGVEAVNAELVKQADNLKLIQVEMEKIAKANEGEVELRQIQLDLEVESILAKERFKEAIKETVDLQRQLKELQAEGSHALSVEIDMVKEQIKAKEKIRAKSQDDLDLAKQKISATRELQKAEKTYGKDYKKNIGKANKDINTVGKATKEFAGRLPVIGPALSDAFGQGDSIKKYGTQLTGLSKGMKDGFGKTATGKLGKFFTGMSKTTMLIVTFITKLFKMGLEFDNLSKSIGKATGFGNDFAGTLTDGYKQTMSSGVAMSEYAGAVTSLANGFSGFNPTAEKTNIHLANTASQLTKLGVSADSSSKLMDHFHRAMGVSQKAAGDMAAQLVLMGKQAGITAGKMASDFQSSAGRLAIYGKSNIKVFKQLAAQAKATGLEMSTLLGISEKFDTFEGAADSAANLNAVLGTQLSTLELMNATDAERIKMMKEQVQASVGNFDSLDKFTKMHIAKAMGLKDVAAAQRLLNMSEAEAAGNAAKMQESADVQKELADRTKDLVPLMDKLKIAFMKFVMAFSPIIKGFTWLVGILAKVADGVGWFLETFGPVIVIIFAVGKAFAAITAAATGFLTPIGWVIIAVGALYVLFDQLKGLFGFKINPLFVNIFSHLAEGLMMMVSPLGLVIKGMEMMGGAFDYLFGEAKEEGASLTEGGFDIQALAEIDTSKVAAGINEIKSAVMELAGITMMMDGFLAMHTDGSSSSFVMGSDGLIKSISEGRLIVDVKMPEMKLPEVLVKVFIGDRELRTLITEQVHLAGRDLGT